MPVIQFYEMQVPCRGRKQKYSVFNIRKQSFSDDTVNQRRHRDGLVMRGAASDKE